MSDLPSHHFIYGTCTDFVTGEALVDTDDERYRQNLARFLVKEKKYHKSDLLPRRTIETLFSNNFVVSTVDLTLLANDKMLFVLRYAPGSLVTRERSAQAAARVLNKQYQIPYAVVTNGEDLTLLETATGTTIASGFDAFPDRDTALRWAENAVFLDPLQGKQRERELRILNSYDVEICCAGNPCALPNAPEG